MSAPLAVIAFGAPVLSPSRQVPDRAASARRRVQFDRAPAGTDEPDLRGVGHRRPVAARRRSFLVGRSRHPSGDRAAGRGHRPGRRHDTQCASRCGGSAVPQESPQRRRHGARAGGARQRIPRRAAGPARRSSPTSGESGWAKRGTLARAAVERAPRPGGPRAQRPGCRRAVRPHQSWNLVRRASSIPSACSRIRRPASRWPGRSSPADPGTGRSDPSPSGGYLSVLGPADAEHRFDVLLPPGADFIAPRRDRRVLRGRPGRRDRRPDRRPARGAQPEDGGCRPPGRLQRLPEHPAWRSVHVTSGAAHRRRRRPWCRVLLHRRRLVRGARWR